MPTESVVDLTIDSDCDSHGGPKDGRLPQAPGAIPSTIYLVVDPGITNFSYLLATSIGTRLTLTEWRTVNLGVQKQPAVTVCKAVVDYILDLCTRHDVPDTVLLETQQFGGMAMVIPHAVATFFLTYVALNRSNNNSGNIDIQHINPKTKFTMAKKIITARAQDPAQDPARASSSTCMPPKQKSKYWANKKTCVDAVKLLLPDCQAFTCVAKKDDLSDCLLMLLSHLEWSANNNNTWIIDATRVNS